VQGDTSISGKQSALQFSDVTFYYPKADEPALSYISFTAKPGKVTAIIGGTGSGKTTLLQLILSFYEIKSRKNMLNNLDITADPVEEVRAKIGLVPQQELLFSGTIAENIQFGNRSATDEEIRRAAEIAQASEFIEKLPEK